jgi:hypothetical protein
MRKGAKWAKEALAAGLVVGAVGAGVGTIVEASDVNTANGKVLTIDTCREIGYQGLTISSRLLECLQHGVPGGTPIKGVFHEGDPIEFVDSSLKHNEERSSFDPVVVAEWAVGAPAVAALVVVVFG